MVQEYVSPVRVHKYPFEMVMAAYERRFPSCAQIPVVIECVITEDSWSADDSQRDTTRRCQLNVEAPYLLKKMIGVDYIYFIQKNHLDLKARFLEIEATNETFASRVGVIEKCKYYVHPENPEWTCFEQSALLDVKNFFGLENTVEKIAMKQYAANIAKGKELIESFMAEVHAEGVTDLRPWAASEPARNRELRRVVSRGTEPLSPRPAAEARRHSQPGPSSSDKWSALNLSKSSHKSLHGRSKSATRELSPDRSHRNLFSHTKLNLIEPSKSGVTGTGLGNNPRGSSKNLLSEQKVKGKSSTNWFKTPGGSKDSKTRNDRKDSLSKNDRKDSLSKNDRKDSLSKKERKEDKKKKALSTPDLSPEVMRDLAELNIDGENNVRPCHCSPLGGGGGVVEVGSRWDHLVVLLACAMLLAVLLSTPMSYLFQRRDDQYSLDSEYIKRYLGELTPMQESRLMQLRKWIADLQKGKVPSDTTLLRFLRARDFNVEKAREMLSQALLWRKKHQVDRLLGEYEPPEVVRQYFPGGWHHHDKDGRPLYILRLGQMDVKGLLKSIGEDGLLKLTLHVCEEGLKLLEEATRSSEHAVQAWSLLVDLDGLNMRHLWRPGVRALLRVIQVVEANYPETMGRVLIVRAPRVFPILWTIVSTFIDENTRSKFLFYGGKDYLQPGGLLDYIPKDLIPDFLGGPCKSFVHEGGLVPKNLYVSGAFTERDGDPLSEDSIYRSVSLAKGQVHEVVVVNRDPQSVLTWDFDVLRHDIAFTVYRSDKDLDAPDYAAVACGGGGGADESSVLAGAREGTHYLRVEPTLVCHDGESIQGSHVMAECGSYVLQWRCELPDSAHRAAQLVYFHETLASHHYRGSMSSLQSGTSGFSCLSGKSVGSSCPSR